MRIDALTPVKMLNDMTKQGHSILQITINSIFHEDNEQEKGSKYEKFLVQTPLYTPLL